MQRPRTPQQDKALDYERQHFTKGKSDKGFRKKWPLKKAIAQRQYRHKVANTLARGGDADDLQSEVLSYRRDRVSKWGVHTLREMVEHKKLRRLGSVGAKKKRMERMLADIRQRCVEEGERLSRLQADRAAVEKKMELRRMWRIWGRSSGSADAE